MVSWEDEAGALLLFLLAVLKIDLFSNLLADVSLEDGKEHFFVQDVFPQV